MKDTEKAVIAAFDFDGTITTKDTLFDFIRFCCGVPGLLSGLVFLSPILFFFKLGLIRNDKAKQKLLSYFFKGFSVDKFNRKSIDYATKIDTILRPDIADRLAYHKENGHKIIIISASVENWIRPWAERNGISEVLGTRLETENGVLTGHFSSPNCYGAEKVNRLKAVYPDRENYILYAYGDSAGDKELLAFADYPTLVQ